MTFVKICGFLLPAGPSDPIDSTITKLVPPCLHSPKTMKVAPDDSTLPPSDSSGGRSMFSLKRRTGSVRQDISLDLGCSNDEKGTPMAMVPRDEEDTLFMQLECGLFGTVQPLKSVARSRSFFLSRGRKQVDRNTSSASNESADSDQFIWTSDGDALTPDTTSK